MKILIVDDTPVNISVLYDNLVNSDYTVLVAEDGESALDIVRRELPDLILLDIMMPGIDGFEVCRQLKSEEQTAAIPIIFMSALTEKDDKVKGLELGAVDYITKPFQDEEVLARVHTHLLLQKQQKDLAREIEERKQIEDLYRINEINLRRELDINRILNKVSESIISADMDIPTLADTILKELTLLLNCEAGFVVIKKEVMGEPLIKLLFTKNQPDEGTEEKIAANLLKLKAFKEAFFSMKPNTKPWYERSKPILRVRSVLSVPLVIKNTFSGVITFFNAANEFNQIKLQSVERIASQFTLGLTNKLVSEQLRLSEKRNTSLIRAIPDLVFKLDDEGVFLDYQGGEEGNLLASPETFLGKKISDVLPDEISAKYFFFTKKAIRDNTVELFEYSMTLNNKVSFYEARIVPVSETEIITFVRNITEQKEARIRIEEARKLAEEANEAKSQFLANMSHELRTPLNGILGYAQLLKRDVNINPRQAEGLEVIISSGTHLMNLINEILDYAKIEAAAMNLYKSQFSLKELLNNVAAITKLRCEKKNLLFVADFQADLPEFIYEDERRLNQILLNLLGNAVKFTKKGEVRLSVEFVNERLIFTISDTGVGIAEDEFKYLFTPFKQGASNDGKTEGTGLGLAISSDLVALLGGTLSVESKPSEGSAFRFDIPVVISGEEGNAEKADKHLIKGYKGERRVILIADDVDMNRTFLNEMLEVTGFTVIEAKNGEETVQKAANHKPDCILLDLVMPVMDGFQAAKELKDNKDTKDIKIIAVSAFASDASRRKAFSVGCDGFLPKPFKEKELFDRLGELLNLEYSYDESYNEYFAETAETFEEDASDAVITLPANEQIEKIMLSIKSGDVSELKRMMNNLLKENEVFEPFVKSANVFIKDYLLQDLFEFIKKHQLKEAKEPD